MRMMKLEKNQSYIYQSILILEIIKFFTI